MKKTAISLTPMLSLTLMATVLAGAVWTASGAPISKHKTSPMSTKTPGTPVTGAAHGAVAPTANHAPDTTVPGTAQTVEPNFTASRFPGVSVRHVPSPSPARSTQTNTQGVVLKNSRPAPVPQGGVMADIDPSSYPAQTATVRPAKKTRHQAASKTTSKAASTTAARGAGKKHRQ